MTTIGIGTEKGGYLLSGTGDEWDVSGPLFPGWKVATWRTTPSGRHLAALASNWFGSSIHASDDLETWNQVEQSPAYDEGRTMNQVWTIENADDGYLLAGVDEAGLFRSDDDGATWHPVEALNDHPSRGSWFPGFGGLCAHHILTDGDEWWVGISAVGVFHTADAGATFTRRDNGISWAVEEGTAPEVEEPGFCVHSIANDPSDPARIWRQDHSGVYRTVDGALTWQRIENGLPSAFGFSMSRHASGRLFVVPLEADQNRVPKDGRFAVYASDDDGDSWHVAGTGWPEEPTFATVLRKSVTIDGDSVFVGTTGGEVWVSHDVGESWSTIPSRFPRILSVVALGA